MEAAARGRGIRCEGRSECFWIGPSAPSVLGHPELAHARRYDGDAVIGGAAEEPAVRAWSRGTEHRVLDTAGAVKQDGEQQSVRDSGEIAQRPSGVAAEFIAARNPMHPGVASTVGSSVRSKIGA